jgi:type I restriction enzyme S subunit
VESNLVQNPKLLSNLPSSWSVLFFQDLVKDFSGGNKKILKSEFLDKGKYLIVDQGKEMVAGFTNDVDALVNSSPPYIIFGDHTRIFKYINVAFAMGADGTKVLKAQDENNLNEKFLYYFFLTLNIPNTGYNRHFKYLKNSKIPLPPLAEQQKIAEILDAADALRQKDQQLIDHYTTLSQSLFLEMFGDPVTNPMGWDIVKWSECLEIRNGKNQKKVENLDGKYPIMGSGGFMSYADEYISEKNTVILGRKGNINKPILVKERYWNVDTAFGLHPNKSELDFNYLYYFCIRYNFEQHNKTVTIPSLTKATLLSIKLPLPPITLQNQFAQHIEKIEKQKQQAQASLAQSNNLFNSLLQKAFTGELTA